MKNVSNKTFFISFLSVFFLSFITVHIAKYWTDQNNQKDLKEFVKNIDNEYYCKHYFVIENDNIRNLCKNKRHMKDREFLLRLMANKKHDPEFIAMFEKFTSLAISTPLFNEKTKNIQPVHLMNRFKQIKDLYETTYTSNIEKFDFSNVEELDQIYKKIDSIGSSIVEQLKENYKSIEQNGFKYG